MIASAIRSLAASKNSTRVAAAFFERRVQTWDLESRAAISDFDTVFSFGGTRLALDSSGARCFAAGWEGGPRGGVGCYDAATGKRIWHRPDLRQTQLLRVSAASGNVWWIPETGPTKLLDSANGYTLDSIRGLKRIFDSEYSPDLLLEKRKRDYILKGDKSLRIPRLTFGILDAAFSPRSLAISEMGGPVRCIDSGNGEELWRHSPGRDSHVGELWYRDSDASFYGVKFDFGKGSCHSLVRLTAESGESLTICPLVALEEVYSAKLGCVVTSSGEMINVSDGELLHTLQFPQREIPLLKQESSKGSD